MGGWLGGEKKGAPRHEDASVCLCASLAIAQSAASHYAFPAHLHFPPHSCIQLELCQLVNSQLCQLCSTVLCSACSPNNVITLSHVPDA